MKKSDWERMLELRIGSTMKESYRLLKTAMKKPDPSVLKLASLQLEEASDLMLMRNSVRHVKDENYEFDCDEDGDPVFHLRGLQTPKAENQVGGYI